MPNLPFIIMTNRIYSIVCVFIINLIMFNWHNQHSVFSFSIILWSLVPLFGLHYVIKHYEVFHNKALTVIRSYSAWVLFFAWITCICFSITMPYAVNVISETSDHYISLYLLSPAVSLFVASIAAFIASLITIIVARLVR